MTRLRIGFIPLADAAPLLIAIDKGFAEREGLEIEAVREVSWSNVRDKLNIGLFDAAHMLTPMAIASALGIGHVRAPLVAPLVLALNGNAITVSPALHEALMAELDGGEPLPLATAEALARVVRHRRGKGLEPLTFGMTFPFSNHNYQLRFWMAAGGVDPDEDVRLVVLPPPYMAASLGEGQVDGFCAGAPWNSVAVEAGTGRILHFGCEIVERLAEKVLAVRAGWAEEYEAVLMRLMRAVAAAAEYTAQPENWEECARLLAAPHRIGVRAELIERTLAGRLKVSPDGTVKCDAAYLIPGAGAAGRPDPVQAAWLYAQMVRWGQTELRADALAEARAVLSPALFGRCFAEHEPSGTPADGVGAFAGPPFDAGNIGAYLAACRPPHIP